MFKRLKEIWHNLKWLLGLCAIFTLMAGAPMFDGAATPEEPTIILPPAICGVTAIKPGYVYWFDAECADNLAAANAAVKALVDAGFVPDSPIYAVRYEDRLLGYLWMGHPKETKKLNI